MRCNSLSMLNGSAGLECLKSEEQLGKLHDYEQQKYRSMWHHKLRSKPCCKLSEDKASCLKCQKGHFLVQDRCENGKNVRDCPYPKGYCIGMGTISSVCHCVLIL